MRIAPTSAAFMLLLGVFAGLPALSVDLSAPTLVDLPAALRTTTTVAGMTLSLFMVGFALGQLCGGRASDRWGRRPILLAALFIYASAGSACALATSGPALAIGRLVQGAGAGGCAVLAYAIVQDLFEGEAARARRSYVTVVLGITPVLAPALGVWLGTVWGWRSVHVVLAIAGSLLLVLVAAAVGESRGQREARPIHGVGRLRNDSRFVGLAVVNALSYATLFAYIAGAPVVVMGEMGYTARAYAALFAATALALSAGAWTSGRLGRRGLSAAQLVWPGLAAQACGCVALALSCTGARSFRAEIGVVLLVITCFARGITAPNLVHLAIGSRREDAGWASAMLGVLQLILGAAASAVVAILLPVAGVAGVVAPMALLAGSAAILWLVVTRRERPVAPQPADGS